MTIKTSPIPRVSEVCTELELVAPQNFIFVDIDSQSLFCYKESEIAMSCPISTSKFGIGNREGSNMTPLGLHKIEEKIGEGAAPWTIFRARVDTGVIWNDEMDNENQILTRILRLRGLEPGINAGEGIDSYDRYIYIHGTNREDLIGQPMSHGCVCMKNNDVMRLFDMVETGTIVYLNKEAQNAIC